MNTDNKQRCQHEGCQNVGEWDKVKNHKVYRRKYCSSHRMKFGLNGKRLKWKKNLGFQQKYKLRGLSSKCMVCGWDGPCDCHRIDEGGRYKLDNVASICPNCHRLIHLKLLDISSMKEKFIELNKAHLNGYKNAERRALPEI